jgi:PPOX class probable F420-dependent enzyme
MTDAVPEAVRRLFKGPNFGHLATLMPDGSPQVTPVWVDIDDEGRVLVNTAEGRAKPANVRRDPRVAISVSPRDRPESAAFIRGRVVELRHDNAWDHHEELAARYVGRPRKDPDGSETRVILVIEPDHIATWRLD